MGLVLEKLITVQSYIKVFSGKKGAQVGFPLFVLMKYKKNPRIDI